MLARARYLTNMTRLTLAHNKLTGKWAYFPISSLSNLTELRLTGNMLREPRLLLLQWVVTVFVALGVGGTFFRLSYDLPGIQNRTGVLFFTILYFSIVSLSSLPVLADNRIIFLREVSV